jgi:hypothetical protein
MKKSIFTSIVFILTTILYGQQNTIEYDGHDSLNSKSEIKISIAPTINNALYYQFVSGGPARNFKPGFTTSFEYLFKNDKKINFGFGLCYQFTQVEYTSTMDSGEFTGQTDIIHIISINFAAVLKMKHDFYLSLNPLINFQLNKDSDFYTDNQNGLGLSFSFGKYINLKNNIRLNIEPRLLVNTIVPFNPDDYMTLRMTSVGINIGLVFGGKPNHSHK